MFEGNDLMSALRPAEARLLAVNVCEVELTSGEILYQAGDVVTHAFFPRHDAVASFIVELPDGQSVETAIVGREGAVGGIVSHGQVKAFASALIVHGGSFYRVSTSDLEMVKQQAEAMRSLFARYSDFLLAQVFQSVACSATHTLGQRIAKWLCAALDRTGTRDITTTQVIIAEYMGVGRSYTSRVIQTYKAAGLLRTRRGGIVVLDHKGLEAQACICNRIIKDHHRTVLGGLYD